MNKSISLKNFINPYYAEASAVYHHSHNLLRFATYLSLFTQNLHFFTTNLADINLHKVSII